MTLPGPQLRSNLCDLFWEGLDDPRAALRWSLTKLRPIVNGDSTPRLEADRERVRFTARGARVDTERVANLMGEGPRSADLRSLEEAAALLSRGEFLDGLDLPRCYRFHHWCLAERERVGALRREVLRALIERLKQEPERALPYAHALASADPLSETAHALLVEVLTTAARSREAEAHYTYARDLLRRELAAPLSGVLQHPATQEGGKTRPTRQSTFVDLRPKTLAPGAEGYSPAPLVGHIAARWKIDETLRFLAEPSKRPMLMFVGEPGIGKSRLLAMLTDKAAAVGARIVSARCFEAEMVRPYGLWSDALRGMPSTLIQDENRQDLALLQPTPKTLVSTDGSRARLFTAVANLLERLAHDRPLVIALDDLQWIDEASASLLHFLVRTLGPLPILFAATARKDEIDDNPWAKRLLRSLERDCCLDEVALGPLSSDETATLLDSDATDPEIAATHRESGGNPLYILELVHAKRHGTSVGDQTLETLIEQRLERLDLVTRDVISYAAAIGREFRADILDSALGVSETRLVEALEQLKRRGLLRTTVEGHVDFCHDLVRRVAYHKLSQPRRRLIHKHLTVALSAAARTDVSLHGELLYHAGLAGKHELAAHACVAAGDHCIRIFAHSEAEAVADRGLPYIQRMPPGRERTQTHIALLNVKVQSAFHLFSGAPRAKAPTAELVDEIRRAADEADVMGMSEEAALAHNLVAWLTWRSNESDTASSATLDAERASRKADDATRCLHLANTGRCLLEVEADIERSRQFVNEAASLAAKLGVPVVEIDWGLGLIARWDGDLDLAYAHLTRARTLANFREDRWREIECTQWLAKIALELRNYDKIIDHCVATERLANRIKGAHAPNAKALRLLAQLRKSGGLRECEVDELVAELREFDDKASFAYFLNECALFELESGAAPRARAHACDALVAASAVRRPTEIIVAGSILARVAHAEGDVDECARHMSRLTEIGDTRELSARARSNVDRALATHDHRADLVHT